MILKSERLLQLVVGTPNGRLGDACRNYAALQHSQSVYAATQ